MKSVEDEDEGADGNSSSRFSGGTMSGTLGQSSVYDIINKAVNKEKLTIAMPKGFLKRVQYFFFMPLTHS